MLPRRQRLLRAEFATLLAHGRRIHGRVLTLIVRSAATTKCGVVVSKKTARSAVARNRLRRSVYQILQHHIDHMEAMHIAVLTRPQAAQRSSKDLEQQLTTLLTRLL